MFCPKCGAQNPETGKFCRSCGTDLGNVSAALSGSSPVDLADVGPWHKDKEGRRRSDPNEVFADAVKNVMSGLGFLAIAIVLFTTGVAGGQAWWWAMLFPAFTFLSKGISDYLKSRRMERQRIGFSNQAPSSLNSASSNVGLPPSQTQYVEPESRFKTGDLVPPSVTDGTTRHLEMDSEGQTMTLPKK